MSRTILLAAALAILGLLPGRASAQLGQGPAYLACDGRLLVQPSSRRAIGNWGPSVRYWATVEVRMQSVGQFMVVYTAPHPVRNAYRSIFTNHTRARHDIMMAEQDGAYANIAPGDIARHIRIECPLAHGR